MVFLFLAQAHGRAELEEVGWKRWTGLSPVVLEELRKEAEEESRLCCCKRWDGVGMVANGGKGGDEAVRLRCWKRCEGLEKLHKAQGGGEEGFVVFDEFWKCSTISWTDCERRSRGERRRRKENGGGIGVVGGGGGTGRGEWEREGGGGVVLLRVDLNPPNK